MAGSLSEERGPLASGSSLLKHTHTSTQAHTPPLACPPTISPLFSPFSPLPSSMLSSPTVLIHRPSQELSYPSGQARFQLGGERDGGVEGGKMRNGKRAGLRQRDEGVGLKEYRDLYVSSYFMY